nr:uncharacterized protein LOC129152946 [Nothobranchius furzeri]
MLVDTGATYSCIKSNYATHLPMSEKSVKTTGFSGAKQINPLTAPVRLAVDDSEIVIPILISDQTPVNLLGRDALCKLKTKIWCTPEGIYVDSSGINFQMTAQTKHAKVYWLGDINKPVSEMFQQWEKFIEAQIPEATVPFSDYHCTMTYDPSCSRIFEEKWDKETKDLHVRLVSQYIVIGQQGAAVNVEENPFIEKWHTVPESAPHITLMVNKGFESKDLGPMMLTATKTEWQKTDNPLIYTTKNAEMIKILCGTTMMSKPQVVTVANKKHMQGVAESETVQNELKADMLKQIPDQLWSKHDTDVGLVTSATPVQVELKPNARLPYRPQYPLKPEAEEGINATIEGLIQAGVLKETYSTCNTPILPVLKADKLKYRLVHDLRAVNDVITDFDADVPNPSTLLSNIDGEAKYFTVIDLCSAFFSIPLAKESQYLFAFTFRGRQLTYRRLPQGLKHSPHIFNQILKRSLEGIEVNSTVIQYVDDLLICARTIDDCHRDSIKVLQKLARGGHKASLTKLQYCQPQVEYLGRVISHGTVAISPEHVEGVSKAPQPQTIGQMMTFLGMTGFNSEWIENYAEKTAPLRALIKDAGSESLKSTLKWTNEAKIAFETIKQDMQTAPSLATPDYTKPFLLYVANRHDMYASAVLMQDTCSGRRKQPIAYYSAKLDNVAQGWPPCYQGLAALHYAYEKASVITMGYPVTIYTHHKISELINRGKFVLNQARCLQYMPLLTYPDVVIKRCTTTNPANSVPFEFEGEPHCCIAEVSRYTKLRPDLESTPFDQSDVTYFVDGSCFRDYLGNHAAFAVVEKVDDRFETVKAEKCNQPCSAQLAELKALTEACKLASGQVATIYTDSAYAHGVCHLFGSVWRQRGFKKTDGTPILHGKQINELISAMMLPSKLAIVKCPAHRKGNCDVIRGNNAADEAAKSASRCEEAILTPVISLEPVITPEDIILIQEKAEKSEQQCWRKRGATMDSSGLWRSHEGLIVAPVSLLTMLISESHAPDHCGRTEVLKRLNKQGYWSPYLKAMVEEVIDQCDICAENNVKKGITVPAGHIPVPEGPFKHLVIDYVDMIKSVHGKRYMLVIIDRFSRWIEAVPSKDLGSETVVKFLVREVIPRFGIPSEISSDNGPAFVEKVLKGVLQQLRIKQRLGSVYHPQSQGMVERANLTLKSKICKICACTNLNWVDALPLALMSYRMQTNRSTHLSPHEVLTGRPMPAPQLRGPHKGPSLEQLELEFKSYIKQLTSIHKAIYLQEKRKELVSSAGADGPVVPGDQVYIKVFRRKWHEPRREGPYKVVRATPTAVQVEGGSTWHHLTHCTKVKDKTQGSIVSDVTNRHDGRGKEGRAKPDNSSVLDNTRGSDGGAGGGEDGDDGRGADRRPITRAYARRLGQRRGSTP